LAEKAKVHLCKWGTPSSPPPIFQDSSEKAKKQSTSITNFPTEKNQTP